MSASVSASSAGWFSSFTDVDSDSATWSVSTPTAAVVINWNSGANVADAATFPRLAPQVTESKFFVTIGAGPPIGPITRVFTGFSRTNTGPLGSSATCSGSGLTSLPAGTILGVNWRADWTVTAAGILAMATALGPLPTAFYDSAADADDPVPITRAQLADMGVTGGRFRFYLPAGLEALAHSEGGQGGFSVSFETSDGEVMLVSLASGASGISVGGDEPDFLRIYRIRDYDENPMARAERPLSRLDVQDSFSTLFKTRVLRAPLRFGLLLDNIPVPTVEIAPGGVVAQYHVRTNVADSARREGDKIIYGSKMPQQTGSGT